MKNKNILMLMALSLAFTACGNQSPKEADTKTQVEEPQKTDKEVASDEIYGSFYPIYNLAKQIAGDKFNIKAFNSLTSESHGWEPSAKDMAELSEAKLLFINGAGMEEWKDSVEESLDIEMVDTSKDLDLIKASEEDHDHDHDHEDADHDHDHEEGEEGHHHHHGEFDPHTWLSPVNIKAQAKVIADKLSEIDPANKDYYQENYEKIAADLDGIIEEYKDKFSKVENKKFIVPHQAFGYIARDFGLEQIPLASLTSTDDPDAKAMKEVTDLAKANKLNTVFYEAGGSDKAAKTIADEIGAKVAPLNTMEFASKEELDKEVKIQDIIKENLENIYKSLA